MFWKFFTAAALAPLLLAKQLPIEKISASVSVVRGPVNGVLIQRHGAVLAIYGDPRPDPVTHNRFCSRITAATWQWAGRRLVERDAEGVRPEAEERAVHQCRSISGPATAQALSRL